MIENNINVKLSQFDGPLGLLLHLIQRDELSIRSLNINDITSQYLDYLKKMQKINFDLAGEYLYMAATLLYIKSRDCIETSEREKIQRQASEHFNITTKTQLIERLEMLERFQGLGEKLWSLPRKNKDIFTRPKLDRKKIVNSILTPMSLQELTTVMIDLLKREKRKYTVVKRDRLSIKEKLQFLKTIFKVGTTSNFFSLLSEQKDHEDKVITFISILELARLKKIEIFQNEKMGNIFINVVESLSSFNVETAIGFESEEELANNELEKTLEQNTLETSIDAQNTVIAETHSNLIQ